MKRVELLKEVMDHISMTSKEPENVADNGIISISVSINTSSGKYENIYKFAYNEDNLLDVVDDNTMIEDDNWKPLLNIVVPTRGVPKEYSEQIISTVNEMKKLLSAYYQVICTPNTINIETRNMVKVHVDENTDIELLRQDLKKYAESRIRFTQHDIPTLIEMDRTGSTKK